MNETVTVGTVQLATGDVHCRYIFRPCKFLIRLLFRSDFSYWNIIPFCVSVTEC